jgi:hypothetical protein
VFSPIVIVYLKVDGFAATDEADATVVVDEAEVSPHDVSAINTREAIQSFFITSFSQDELR